MPPIRRNRPAGTPARHPKVAGTRGRPATERFEDPAAAPEEFEDTAAPAPAPVEDTAAAELSARGVLEPEAPAEPEPTPEPVVKPRPSAKAAKPKPAPEPQPDSEAKPDPEPEADADSVEPRRSGWLLPAALVLVAAVLTVLGFWFRGEYLQAESGGSNQALVDNARTSEVVGQVTNAIQTVLSYNFAEPQKNEDAAKAVLMGKATQDYDTILTGLRKTGPEQKLVYSTIVRSAAVRVLEGDRAMVLVFADQHSERASDGYRGDTALQVVVNMQQVDGKWKITEIQPR
ncbi:hypothetical protein N8J89_38560 [Crossiella sp. CA-258035]|uniref:hypothetical protein n=1 Tax=Crossiella sp. CA-258035 TaxID=2981138 RepID=UPI0024BD0ED5|nr:hypothetical protein [Crossiella sp. CA-258035]WHT18941.1 hypothetical protein N8J89_38560 [Crossiella sp. CA-258035]